MKQMMPFGLIHLPVLNNIALTHHRLCLPPCLALTQAGGSQSAHDNQGRKAKSAGAMLRRYGEQALREVRIVCWTVWWCVIRALVDVISISVVVLCRLVNAPLIIHHACMYTPTYAGRTCAGCCTSGQPSCRCVIR